MDEMPRLFYKLLLGSKHYNDRHFGGRTLIKSLKYIKDEKLKIRVLKMLKDETRIRYALESPYGPIWDAIIKTIDNYDVATLEIKIRIAKKYPKLTKILFKNTKWWE